MNNSPYTIEIQYKVWDTENKQFIEIAPDTAGLGCIEVSQKCGSVVDRITMPPEMALMVADAIKRLAEHMIEQNG